MDNAITSDKFLEVVRAVKSERVFQDVMSGTDLRPDMLETMSMGDLLGAIDVNINKAKNIWYNEAPPYPETMNMLRKVAALAVKAGEQFGMPDRQLNLPNPS